MIRANDVINATFDAYRAHTADDYNAAIELTNAYIDEVSSLTSRRAAFHLMCILENERMPLLNPLMNWGHPTFAPALLDVLLAL